jgi:hypothetical protein
MGIMDIVKDQLVKQLDKHGDKVAKGMNKAGDVVGKKAEEARARRRGGQGGPGQERREFGEGSGEQFGGEDRSAYGEGPLP